MTRSMIGVTAIVVLVALGASAHKHWEVDGAIADARHSAKGVFGRVYHMCHNNGSCPYVAKAINLRHLLPISTHEGPMITVSGIDLFRLEVTRARRAGRLGVGPVVRHSFVQEDPWFGVIVTDRLQDTMGDRLLRAGNNETQVMTLLCHLSHVMDTLDQTDLVHGDVRMTNVMFSFSSVRPLLVDWAWQVGAQKHEDRLSAYIDFYSYIGWRSWAQQVKGVLYEGLVGAGIASRFIGDWRKRVSVCDGKRKLHIDEMDMGLDFDAQCW